MILTKRRAKLLRGLLSLSLVFPHVAFAQSRSLSHEPGDQTMQDQAAPISRSETSEFVDFARLSDTEKVQFLRSLIAVLVRFEQYYIDNPDSAAYRPLLMNLLATEAHAAAVGSTCIVCGFISKVGKNGRCAGKKSAMLDEFGKEVKCAGRTVLCNPALFGDNDGKGVCIDPSGTNNFTMRAYQDTLQKDCSDAASKECKERLKNISQYFLGGSRDLQVDLLQKECKSAVAEWMPEQRSTFDESVAKLNESLKDLAAKEKAEASNITIARYRDRLQPEKTFFDNSDSTNFVEKQTEYARLLREEVDRQKNARSACVSGTSTAKCNETAESDTFRVHLTILKDQHKEWFALVERHRVSQDKNRWTAQIEKSRQKLDIAFANVEKQSQLLDKKVRDRILPVTSAAPATTVAANSATDLGGSDFPVPSAPETPTQRKHAADDPKTKRGPAKLSQKGRKYKRDFANTCMDLLKVLGNQMELRKKSSEPARQ